MAVYEIELPDGSAYEVETSDQPTQPQAPQPGVIERYATPAGAVAGGIAGLFTGNPILGGGLGTTAGKYVEQKAKQQRTGTKLPLIEVAGGQAAAVGTDLALGGLGRLLAPVARGVPYTRAFKGGERFAERLAKSPATVDLTQEAETLARARHGVNPALDRGTLSKAEQFYQNATQKSPVEDLLNARGQVPVSTAHDVGNLANQNLAKSFAEMLGESFRGGNKLKQLGLKAGINQKIQAADPALQEVFKNYGMGQNINNVVSSLNPLNIPQNILRLLRIIR